MTIQPYESLVQFLAANPDREHSSRSQSPSIKQTSIDFDSLVLAIDVDDTAAFQRAFVSRTHVVLPARDFTVSGLVAVSNLVNFKLSGIAFGACNINFTTPTAGFVFANCSRSTFENCTFAATAGKTSGDLVIFNAGGGDAEISFNQFYNAPGHGLFLDGSLTGSSGFKVFDNTFIGNGAIGNVAQFYAVSAQDTWIKGNDFGVWSLTGPFAPYGAYLAQCCAGNYESNFHWSNLCGCRMDSCHYARIVANRFETNQEQGYQNNSSIEFIFSLNTLHTNSMQTPGAYNYAEFVGAGASIISGNNLFQRDGVSNSKYCMTFDTTCNSLLISDNIFQHYTISPVLFTNPNYQLCFKNNLPVQFGLDQARSCWAFAHAAAVPPGWTVLFGTAGSGAGGFACSDVPRQCVATQLMVSVDTAPLVGQTLVVLLFHNNVATGLTVTLTAGQYQASTLAPFVTFAQGDNWYLEGVLSAATGATAINVRACITFDA